MGVLTLMGTNTYTGGTTVAAGTLKLDFSQAGAPTANIINNASNTSYLVLDGGTLAIQGNAGTTNSQQFNGLTVNPGCSAIVLTASTSNPLLLSLGSISRSPGGTVDFTLPGGTLAASNGITTSSPNTAAGILGGYATVSGGTGWAVSNGTATSITAYNAYTGGNLGTLASNTTANLLLSGPQTAITSATSFNTLNLTGSEGVTMSGSGSLTLVGGGLIGNTSGTISGGTLQGPIGPAGGELIIITLANLTIGSVIADNGGATALTKAGPGTLILTGSNTYSGATTSRRRHFADRHRRLSGRDLGGRRQCAGFQRLRRLDLRWRHPRLRQPDQDRHGHARSQRQQRLQRRHDGQCGHARRDQSLALPSGMSLSVGAGGVFLFGPSQQVYGPIDGATPQTGVAAGAAAVPEPGTLTLLAAGAIALAAYGLRRRRAARAARLTAFDQQDAPASLSFSSRSSASAARRAA